MQNKKVLVIGGGIAGMAGALEVAAKGMEVYLIEKESKLGGHAYDYCCKATDKCNKCSACLVPQAKEQVEKNPLITVYTNSEVSGISGRSGDFTVELVTPEGKINLSVGAVLVATGFQPFDAAKRGEYGYGRNPNVITGLELEKALKEKGSITAAFGKIKNVGFIQCIGSRDLYLENGYCSRVCCMYASKLSRLIRSEFPDADIAIFYMDLQTFGKGFDDFIAAAKNDDNIDFIRGIPSKVFGFPNERLTVRYFNSLTGEAVEDTFDLIVLSAAITPGKDTEKIAGLLNIDLDEYGFFLADPEVPVFTKQPGVYLAGTCQSPKDITDTIGQARAAASAAVSFLNK